MIQAGPPAPEVPPVTARGRTPGKTPDIAVSGGGPVPTTGSANAASLKEGPLQAAVARSQGTRGNKPRTTARRRKAADAEE